MGKDQAVTRYSRLSIRDLLGVFRRRRATILAVVVVCIGIAVCLCFSEGTFYRRSGTFWLEGDPSSGVANGADPMALIGEHGSRLDLKAQIRLLQNDQLIHEALTRIPGAFPRSSEDLAIAAHVRVEREADTNIVVVTSEADRPETADRLLDELNRAYCDVIRSSREQAFHSAFELLSRRKERLRREYRMAADRLYSYRRLSANQQTSAAMALKQPTNLPIVPRTELEDEVAVYRRSFQDLLALELKLHSFQDDQFQPCRLQYMESTVPVGPPWTLNIVVAILVGVLSGFLIALPKDRVRERVRTEGDVRAASRLDILGRLPVVPGWVGVLIWKSRHQAGLDRFRVLRERLASAAREAAHRSDPYVGTDDADPGPVRHVSLKEPYGTQALRSLVVTSTSKGEGKTVVSANLATAMAMDGCKVVLVDANFRNPSVHRLFELPAAPGMSEVLRGDAELDRALMATNIEGLKVLTAGVAPENPARALSSAEMATLHDRLQSQADVVVYDGAPSYALGDAQALASITGRVLVVTELSVPMRDELRETVESLAKANAHILGVVLNKCRVVRSG